jgi:arylformamidase
MNDPRSIARGVCVKGPRVFLDYGSLETPEFQRQSREFAVALHGAGKPVELIFADGCNHFEVAGTLADPEGYSGRAVRRQMKLTEQGT